MTFVHLFGLDLENFEFRKLLFRRIRHFANTLYQKRDQFEKSAGFNSDHLASMPNTLTNTSSGSRRGSEDVSQGRLNNRRPTSTNIITLTQDTKTVAFPTLSKTAGIFRFIHKDKFIRQITSDSGQFHRKESSNTLKPESSKIISSRCDEG